MLGLLSLGILSATQIDHEILWKLWNPFMFHPILEKLNHQLVFSDNFNWPYAYSRSIFDIQNDSFCNLVSSVVNWFGNSCFLACVISFLRNCCLIFLNSVQFLLINLISRFLLPEIRNSFRLHFVFFLNSRIELVYSFRFWQSFVDCMVWILLSSISVDVPSVVFKSRYP